jgi:hypothetical protein
MKHMLHKMPLCATDESRPLRMAEDRRCQKDPVL